MNVTSMTYLDDFDDDFLIHNDTENTVIPLADTIPFLRGKLYRAAWAWVISK